MQLQISMRLNQHRIALVPRKQTIATSAKASSQWQDRDIPLHNDRIAEDVIASEARQSTRRIKQITQIFLQPRKIHY